MTTTGYDHKARRLAALNSWKQLKLKRAARQTMENAPSIGRFKTMEEVKAYLGGDRILCLECGQSYRMLGTHLARIHLMTTDQYRERYGIPYTYGLVCLPERERLSAQGKGAPTMFKNADWLRSMLATKTYNQRRPMPAVVHRHLAQLNTPKAKRARRKALAAHFQQLRKESL